MELSKTWRNVHLVNISHHVSWVKCCVLNPGKDVTTIEIDLKLSSMKPRHGKLKKEIFEWLLTDKGKGIILSGGDRPVSLTAWKTLEMARFRRLEFCVLLCRAHGSILFSFEFFCIQCWIKFGPVVTTNCVLIALISFITKFYLLFRVNFLYSKVVFL